MSIASVIPSCKIKERIESSENVRPRRVWNMYAYPKKERETQVSKLSKLYVQLYSGDEGHHATESRKYVKLNLGLLGFTLSLTRHSTPIAQPEDSDEHCKVLRAQEWAASYDIRGKEAVLQFVKEHHNLVPLLSEAPTHIKRFFGSADPVLEIFADPDDDRRSLTIVIPTEVNATEARIRLDKLRDQWWRKASYDADPEGNLYLNVEFR